MPYPAYGGVITDVLNRWADAGVFAYVLPFLMIFAVVYGILSKTKILGNNKGVNATIALVIGLLALQFDYVPNFFATIFPYAGIGIAILLMGFILVGLIADEKWSKYIWLVLGAIIFLVVVFTALSDFSWWGGLGYSWHEAWPAIVVALVILGLMALIIWGSNDK